MQFNVCQCKLTYVKCNAWHPPEPEDEAPARPASPLTGFIS